MIWNINHNSLEPIQGWFKKQMPWIDTPYDENDLYKKHQTHLCFNSKCQWQYSSYDQDDKV